MCKWGEENIPSSSSFAETEGATIDEMIDVRKRIRFAESDFYDSDEGPKRNVVD